jgi:hypothetical protein
MNKTNNVIDLKSRLERDRGTKAESNASSETPVLDMTVRRQEMLTHERRAVRRTILSEFVGASVVVPGRGLTKAAIYDISETGISLDLDLEAGLFTVGEEVAVRVYLNHQTYFPFIVRVSNARAIYEEGVARHGCHFMKGTLNDEALHHFVKFIETVSASLKTDRGDVMVSNLIR